MTDKRIDMMPLWTDALMGDTFHLSTEAFGAYMRLLIVAWRSKTGDIPACDLFCKNTLGWTPRKWAAVRPEVEGFFQEVEGRWVQKRLKAEWEKAHARVGKDDPLHSKHPKGSQKKQPKSPKKPNDSIRARDRALAGAGAGAVAGNPTHQNNNPPPPSVSDEPEDGGGGFEGFDDWWEAYPATDGHSADRARAEWTMLSEGDRRLAVSCLKTLGPQLAKMDGGGFIPFVFLRDKVFLRATAPPCAAPIKIIPFRTPEQEKARAAELQEAWERQQDEEKHA